MKLNSRKSICLANFQIAPGVSHIPRFGDTITSPTGDADVSAGDAHL
jgi:hypothetical protein